MKIRKILLISFIPILTFVGCSSSIKNRSKNQNCKELNTGDYCFQNNTKNEVVVVLMCSSPKPRGQYQGYNEPRLPVTLKPGQKQCFYDIPAGAASYDIKTSGSLTDRGYKAPGEYKANGNLYVDACKQRLFIIK